MEPKILPIYIFIIVHKQVCMQEADCLKLQANIYTNKQFLNKIVE